MMPGLFSSELVTSLGGFRVFPGLFEDSDWVVEQLLSAIEGSDDFPKDFATDAVASVHDLLRISDAIADRAGIARNAEPEFSNDDLVTIPSAGTLERLCHAVSFTRDELQALVGEDGLLRLEGATTRLGQGHGTDSELSGLLHSRPLVQVGSEFIVALPDALLSAAIHRMVSLARAFECSRELTEKFLVLVLHQVLRSLEEMGLLLVRPPPPGDPTFTDAEALVPFDRDKVLHLIVLADDFEGFSPANAQAEWTGLPSREQIEARFREVETAVFQADPAPNAMMHLVIGQAAGRPFSLVVDYPGPPTWSPRLVLSATELQVLARSERAQPTALWNLAVVANAARAEVRLPPVSQLEEYAFLKKERFDSGRLALVDSSATALLMGFAAQLRVNAALEADRHAALSPDSGSYIPVVRAFEAPMNSIYRPDASPAAPVLDTLVEIGNSCIWVVPDIQPSTIQEWEESRNWLNMISLWLIEASTSGRELFDALRDRVGPVRIRVVWRGVVAASEEALEPWTMGIEPPSELRITLRPGARDLLAGEDRFGELQLVRDILEGLLGLLPESGAGSGEAVSRVIEGATAASNQRMLVRLEGNDPAFLSAGAPYRLVSEFDRTDIERSVGVMLERTGMVRDQPESDSNEVTARLNEAVEFAYRRLEGVVSTLSPDGLLEWLVSLNEELAHREIQLGMTTAMQAGAFGRDVAARLEAERARRTVTAVASRFLIEYVAARPPVGYRAISFTVYDHLLALGALIIDWGSLSDLVREGLSDGVVGLTAWGRFLAGAPQHWDAMTRAEPDLQASEVHAAVQWLRGAQTEQIGETPDEGYERAALRLDQAMAAERGFSVSDQARLTEALLDQWKEEEGAVAVLPLEGTLKGVSQVLGWSVARARTAIEAQALGPREEFLKPPPPYKTQDVYPWRFSRPLSYLSRPLVLRSTDAGTDLVFGPRHLFYARTYFLQELLTGRFPAKTSALKDVLGRMQQAESRAFNDQVGAVFSKVPGLRIRIRFSRVGGSPMLDDQGDVGDIDVLVADPGTRKLVCVETKRLGRSVAPHQLARELERMFGGGSRLSAMDKHQRRVRWIRRNVGPVLEELRLSSSQSQRWRVLGLVVTDDDVLTRYLKKGPMPVRSIREIEEALAKGHLF